MAWQKVARVDALGWKLHHENLKDAYHATLLRTARTHEACHVR